MLGYMITAGVRAAVGDSVDGIEQKPYMGHWAEIILLSDKDGLFESLYISKSMRSYVIEEDLWVMKGDAVHFIIIYRNMQQFCRAFYILP